MKKFLKISIVVILGLANINSLAKQDLIEVHCIYTESHEGMLLKWFLPTIQYFDEGYEVILRKEKQLCPSATFQEKGWSAINIKKGDLILDAIEKNQDRYFIHSDVDIQILSHSLEELCRLMDERKLDILIQRDTPKGNACIGFFICRGNKRTYALWKDAQDSLKKNPHRIFQSHLNKAIRQKHRQIKWDFLPNKYMSGGTFGKVWKPGGIMFVPDDIVLHHATHIKGVPNKIKQLDHVKQRIQKRYMAQTEQLVSNDINVQTYNNSSNYNGWAPSAALVGCITQHIKDGSNLCEIGSTCVSSELAERYQVYSIEHDQNRQRFNSQYIHVPLKDGCYDDTVLANLPFSYDMILVNGVPQYINTKLLALTLSVMKPVPIVIDHAFRPDIFSMALALNDHRQGRLTVYKNSSTGIFDFIVIE